MYFFLPVIVMLTDTIRHKPRIVMKSLYCYHIRIVTQIMMYFFVIVYI